MKRQPAMATALAAGAALFLTSVAVASMSGTPILGFGPDEIVRTVGTRPAEPVVVTQVSEVNDVVVVPSTTPASTTPAADQPIIVPRDLVDALASPGAVELASVTTTTSPTSPPVTATKPLGVSVAVPRAAPVSPTPPPTTAVSPASSVQPAAAVTTTTPPTASPEPRTEPQPRSTTAPSPTTAPAARPPGVPSDWPPDRPIPPMPADCRKPQLEDNGIWNCDH